MMISKILVGITVVFGVEALFMNSYLSTLLVINGVTTVREKFVLCRTILDGLQVGYILFWIAPVTFFQYSNLVIDYIDNVLTRTSAVLWCCSIMIQVITVVERHIAICHGLLHMTVSSSGFVKVTILGTMAFSIAFVQGFWIFTRCSGGYDMHNMVFTFSGENCEMTLNKIAVLLFMIPTTLLTVTLDALTYRTLRSMNTKLTRQSSFTLQQRKTRQRCEDYVLAQTFVLPITLVLQHALFFLRTTSVIQFHDVILNYVFNIFIVLVLYQIGAVSEMASNKSLNSFLYRYWNWIPEENQSPPESGQLLRRRGGMQTDAIFLDNNK